MTKEGFDVLFCRSRPIARNGNQQDYLEDGEAVSSLTSGANTPGITDGTWVITRRAGVLPMRMGPQQQTGGSVSWANGTILTRKVML